MMLVVVKDRNAHLLFQLVFDVEAFRSLDVFQVDAAEGRLQSLDDLAQLVRVGHVQVDVIHVHIGENLEQQALSFHDRLAGVSPDVPQAEHSRAVGNHGHQIAPARIFVGKLLVPGNFHAGFGHAGTVGHGQVLLGGIGLDRHHFYFSGSDLGMVIQGLLFGVKRHVFLL